jgi:hypothetical protein
MRFTKARIIEWSAILVCFVLSLFARWDNLTNPITEKKHFISAHSLITVQIWEEEGFFKHGGNPVYTYAGKGNHKSKGLGGVLDKNGDAYYVSYPPLSFYTLYAFSQVCGGSSPGSLHLLAVIIHLLCAVGLYLLVKQLAQNDEQVNVFSLIPPIAYLLWVGPMWVHGNLYFSDQLEQVFFIFTALISLKLYQGKRFKYDLILFGILIFLSCYTEWLGVFGAFVTGVIFLINYYRKREKYFLHLFLIAGLCSSFSVGLTIFQYSHIDGFESYKEAALNKYKERSGLHDDIQSAKKINLKTTEGFEALEYGWSHFVMTKESFNILLVVLFICLVLKFFLFKDRKSHSSNGPGFLLLIFGIPILMHYTVFFNFNALHPFSGLKTSSLIILGLAVLPQYFSVLLSKRINPLYLAIPILAYVLIKANHGINYYAKKHSRDNVQLSLEVQKIRRTSSKDNVVFTNLPYSPSYNYNAHHNLIPLDSLDYTIMKNYTKHLETPKIDYYHFDNNRLEYLLRFQYDSRVVQVDSVSFLPENSTP